MGYIIFGIIALALFVLLIGLMFSSVVISIGVGLIISIFAGVFSAIKSCIIGVKRNVSNLFVKIVLYFIIGLFILVISVILLAAVAVAGYVIYRIVVRFV